MASEPLPPGITQPAGPQRPLLRRVYPVLAGQLERALRADGEDALADAVDRLEVVDLCRCPEPWCDSIYTLPRPQGMWGDGHRNVSLVPDWEGQLVLDVVQEQVAFVEVLYRGGLD